MSRSFFVFLAFSLIWSWPLALAPGSSTVSLHFDQYPASWLVFAASSFESGRSTLSGWPTGEPLVRLDSFLFLALAQALGGRVSGLLVTNMFVLFGPVFSALGAVALFDRVWAELRPGVPPIYSRLIAGFCFGFAPLATVGVLEGHVYYLLNPWLPLCIASGLRVTSDDGTIKNAISTVVFFAASLLTTAYMGVNALVALALLGLWRWRGARLPVLGAAALGVGVVGAIYAGFFVSGSLRAGVAAASDSADALVRLGSASATTLLAWAPWMDLNRHSLAPALGPATLALGFLAWPARIRGSGLWLVLGLGAGIVTLGPVLELGIARTEAWPTPLYPLLQLGLFDIYRFPIRFGWLAMLGLGIAAALVMSRHRWPWLGLLLVVGDVGLLSGGWTRVRGHPSPAPSLYRLLPEAPVLDLYPEVGGLQEDMGFYFQNLSCYYQIHHRRRIVDWCLNTNLAQSPRLAASRAVHAALLGEGDVKAALRPLRLGSVVLHAGLYQPFERSALVVGLTNALGPALAEGTDGGEWLIAWAAGTPVEE